jgi:hypothetical protein
MNGCIIGTLSIRLFYFGTNSGNDSFQTVRQAGIDCVISDTTIRKVNGISGKERVMKFNTRWTVGIVLLAAFALHAQSNVPPACPFKPAELQAVFGVPFKDGKAGADFSAGGVTMRTCRYESKNYTLSVNISAYASAADAKTQEKYLAGKLVPIPKDPDGAAFQQGQGDMTDPALHYLRGATSVDLRILGIYYAGLKPTEAEFKGMQQKLAKIRRIP